jgi:hypothetical protein
MHAPFHKEVCAGVAHCAQPGNEEEIVYPKLIGGGG